MFWKIAFTLFVLFGMVGVCAAQTGYTPRDADEAEAWQVYQQYKASRAAETAAARAIVQARLDVNQASMSSIGAFGADPEDRARLAALRRTQIAEQKRQGELLEK